MRLITKIVLATVIIFAMLLIVPFLAPQGASGFTKWQLAHIIAGEAGQVDCPVRGRVAVAHVASRNGRWSGWAVPGPADWHIAAYWREYADPTRGSKYLFSDSDLERAAVKHIIAGRATERIACGDLGLNYIPEWPASVRLPEPVPRAAVCAQCVE